MDLDSEMPDCLFDVDLMIEALVTIIRRLMEFMEPPQRLSLKTEVCWDTLKAMSSHLKLVETSNVVEEIGL
ncbi:MAG: hypothetical protein IMF11_05930 [Proteobacteria bacterium]|nr:hypothetical protein [Pseudomonadota bacterium]